MADGLIFQSLRGGMNDELPPHALAEDQCVLAENAEFFWSTLGERRAGCDPFDLTDSGLLAQSTIAHLSEWFPDNAVKTPEWWAIGAIAGVSVAVARRSGGVWAAVSPDDAITSASPGIFQVRSVALNNKLFWAYPSATDRLHCWDKTYLRRTGLAEPIAAPTGAVEGSGSYASVRYFRVRYVEKSGDTVVRRSEPSATLSFTPTGTPAGCRITRPALLGEHETHWEVEASTDNANFYCIETVAKATTIYDDETDYATGYADLGPVSEVSGTYLTQPSCRYIGIDGDRLLMAGHWTDTTQQSRIAWTPVSNDPGDGNDERIPLLTNNYRNLDNSEGGPITGISNAVNGTWCTFKWSHLYRLTRTGEINQAYDVYTVSKKRGAIHGSVVDGVDENGAACVYFLDPTLGPSRIGSGGLQAIRGMGTTWTRVSLNAAHVIAHGVYYPFKQQVCWWIAVDGADRPNLVLKLQVDQIRWSEDSGAAWRGWSIATGRIAEAYCSSILSEITIVNSVVNLSGHPFIGLSAPDLLQRCDVNTTDAGVPYRATIRTRPIFAVGLLDRWGAMTAALLATARVGNVVVKLIRDFSKETAQVAVDLSPEGTEDYVIKALDDLSMSEAKCLQVEFTDPEA